MKSVIDSIKNNLNILFFGHRDYLNDEGTVCDNDSGAHKRIYEIYFTEAPEILIRILNKLKLSDEGGSYVHHTIQSVYLNFWRVENDLLINESFDKYYKKENLDVFLNKLDRLANEMQYCLNGF